MAITIVSIERALAEGTGPEQLRKIADWHDWKERAALAEGETYAARRHNLTAKALRKRADELFATLNGLAA